MESGRELAENGRGSIGGKRREEEWIRMLEKYRKRGRDEKEKSEREEEREREERKKRGREGGRVREK